MYKSCEEAKRKINLTGKPRAQEKKNWYTKRRKLRKKIIE
jgi:hypothetical protein